jgi:DNA-binding NtrC family response regulator
MSQHTVVLMSQADALVKTVAEAMEPYAEFRLEVAGTADDACTRLRTAHACLALVDITHEHENALGVLQTLRAHRRPVATLLLGDAGLAPRAVPLLQQGAVDCLGLPLDLGRFRWLLEMLTARHRTEQLGSPPNQSNSGLENPFYVLSPVMMTLMDQIRKLAPQNTTMLITGETGTGKTRMARVVHELSPRCRKPLLVVDCGALTGTLIESEIFGHVRGSFTGATRDYDGKFTAVGSGTLLLDEIDGLPLSLQAKLLRAVEDRVFEPVGSTRSQPLLARLIVASNRCLEDEVAAGRFRADLYHRLNVIGIHLPPLRETATSIAPLAQHFVNECAAQPGIQVREIAPAALAALERYHWPGNIRELRNAILRAAALADGLVLSVADLPEAVRRAAAPQSAPPSVVVSAARVSSNNLAEIREEAELAHLVEVLKKHGKNRRQAARELGISRTALYNKLNKYGLVDARKQQDETDTPAPGRRGKARRHGRSEDAPQRLAAHADESHGERRGSPRRPIAPLKVMLTGAEHPAPRVHGLIVDCSEGGVGLTVEGNVPPERDVHLFLPGDQNQTPIPLRVRHCESPEDLGARIGCEFLDETPADVLDRLMHSARDVRTPVGTKVGGYECA